MANTFKFGNGNWATKEGSALAYNDENNNFKPLPFDFDRASGATRVNKDGLIEVVGSNEPRIDFLNDTDGALLLEPSRSNLVPYSNGFDNAAWNKSFIGIGSVPVVTANQGLAPDGTFTADRIVLNLNGGVTSGDGSFLSETVTVSSGAAVSLSIYLKSNTGLTQNLIVWEAFTGAAISCVVTNEWQRFNVIATVPSTSSGLNFGLRNAFGVTVDNTADILSWGAQIEEGSYATSYIPTQGSSVTRVNEDIALTLPDDASFNSSNGFSLYGEVLTNGGDGSSPMALQVNGNTGYFGFGHNSATWRARINNGTVNELYTSSASILSVGKLALSFSSSGFSMYANGTSFAGGNTDMSAITSSDSVIFRDNTEEFGSMRIKDLRLYNTRLSNTELQKLTS